MSGNAGSGTSDTTDGTSDKTDDKANGSGTGDDTGTKVTDDPALKTDDVSGLKKALAAERKQREGLEKAARDAELAKLPELERAQSEAIQLRTENERLTTENMRYATAMKLGLPWSIGKRHTGDTPEEMQADGVELAKTYKVDDKKILEDDKNKRPPNDAKRNGGTGKPDINSLLRAMRG